MKYLLFPFSWIYKAITSLRNFLFKRRILKSFEFDVKVIGVGNLAVGGTGKTPHVEYIVRLIKDNNQPAILSRGYGRKSSGFILADDKSDAMLIGDEPLQYFMKFSPHVPVAVGEERVTAIPKLLYEKPETDVIILDDAFQHQYVKPTLNILISEYGKPFFKDFVLPAGRLRESRKGAKRADLIVISKCPADISEKDKSLIIKKTIKYSRKNIPVFFTYYKYIAPIPFSGDLLTVTDKIILLTGIAGTDYLKQHLLTKFTILSHLKFSDHHNYKKRDIYHVIKEFTKACEKGEKVSVLTTEKDMVRLTRYKDILSGFPVFYLPVEVAFTDDGSATYFESIIQTSLIEND